MMAGKPGTFAKKEHAMQVDPFFNGMRNQELRNLQRDMASAQRIIDEQRYSISSWKAAHEQLQSNLTSWQSAHANLQQENADLRAEMERGDQVYKAHYLALEAERDSLLGLLDEAHGGAEANPARQPAYADPDEFRIAHGPRAGQPAEMRDHHYFTKMAELIRTRFTGLGCWKELIRYHRIQE
jgi:septal ring factor EnvC (AmiA/AmiB activator)